MTAPRALDGAYRRRPSCLAMKDALMRRVCTLAAMIWMSGVAAACAQASSTAGMGTTSPLGTTLSDSSSSSGTSMAGIPLAATELAQPGISPLISQCPNTSSNSSFDGGGVSSSTGCSSGGTSISSGTGSATADVSGADAGSTVQSSASAGIPLGATSLGTPGESQNISVPNISVAPCTQTQGAGSSTGSTGVVSSGGC
jgi:hypothetical protein